MLPLALASAGAYLFQLSTSLDESWLRLQKSSPELMEYEDRAIHTTWDLSFARVQHQNKSAGQLLKLWAYLDNQNLWFELLASLKGKSPELFTNVVKFTQNRLEWFEDLVSDELNFNAAVRTLCDHALVEKLEASNGYGMHNCVHEWTKNVLNAKKDPLLHRLAIICVGFSMPSTDNPQYGSWKAEDRILPHANICLLHLASIRKLSVPWKHEKNPIGPQASVARPGGAQLNALDKATLSSLHRLCCFLGFRLPKS